MDTIAATLDAAEHLQLSSLRHHCLQYLGDVTDTDSAVTVWRLARLHGAVDLERRALRLICDCFSVAARDPEFLELAEGELAELLSASYVNAREEQILYVSVGGRIGGEKYQSFAGVGVVQNVSCFKFHRIKRYSASAKNFTQYIIMNDIFSMLMNDSEANYV